MELDDFKTAWQALDRRLAQQQTLALEERRERRLDKAQSRLRPLAWGQALQILSGVVLILISVAFWSGHRGRFHLLAAGVVTQVYGIALIVCAARTFNLLQAIDYAAPVLTIQQRIARLRHWYAFSSVTLGLVWWFLWIPCLMMAFMIVFGADLYANAPSVIWIGVGVGVGGLLLTLWFHRWAQQPGRGAIARYLADTTAGRSIVTAQAEVDDVARFERE